MIHKSELEGIRQQLDSMIVRRRRLGEYDPNAKDTLAMLEVLHALTNILLELVPRKR